MREKPTNATIIHSVYYLFMVAPTCRILWMGVLCLETWCVHHITTHTTPIHNILSTAPQLSTSQKALGTLPEEGNVMPKHVGDTVHN
jgi:hypothetical protein